MLHLEIRQEPETECDDDVRYTPVDIDCEDCAKLSWDTVEAEGCDTCRGRRTIEVELLWVTPGDVIHSDVTDAMRDYLLTQGMRVLEGEDGSFAVRPRGHQ